MSGQGRTMGLSTNGGYMKKRLIWAMLAIATMISSGFTTLPAHAAYPACTTTVADSNVTITGTNTGEVICLTGSNITVNALGGDDIVIDDGSNNIVNLGEGLDIYDGSAGDGEQSTVAWVATKLSEPQEPMS